MNKILCVFLSVFCLSLTALSQADTDATQNTPATNEVIEREPWGVSRPFSLHYGSQTLELKSTGLIYKSDFTAGFSKRRTYYFYRTPFLNMIKFGMDLTWSSIGVAKYTDNIEGDKSLLPAGTTISANDNNLFNYVEEDKYHVLLSLFGFGPMVRVAPFGWVQDENLNKIRVAAYFQYLPTLSGVYFKNNGSNSLMAGYVNRWAIGANLSIGTFGIGVQKTWGQGSMHRVNIENEFKIYNDKEKYLLNNITFYIGYDF